MDAGTFEELGKLGADMAEEAEVAASASGNRIIGMQIWVLDNVKKLIGSYRTPCLHHC